MTEIAIIQLYSHKIPSRLLTGLLIAGDKDSLSMILATPMIHLMFAAINKRDKISNLEVAKFELISQDAIFCHSYHH